VIVDHDPHLLVERYRVGEQLGAGGMGTVFAGHDLRLDRAVAIKLLHPELARDPGLRRRFEREARAAARVSHPNVVSVFDTGEDAALDTFIVMELLSGRTLAHELADGPIDEPRLRAVADEVLAALGAAHDEGIVHRDVKPGNILLADDGSVKVGDFGIATSLESGDTTTAVPLGTPAYTAPERLRGLPATARSDLYSLGVVLYEAAAGTRPFVGDGASAVAEAVVHGEHEPLGRRRPELSPTFVAAVERSMASEPDERFADAAAMREALASADAAPTQPLTTRIETAVLPAVIPAPSHPVPDRPAPQRRRFDARRLAAVAAIVAVVVVLGVLLLPRGDDAPLTPSTAATVAPTTAVTAPLAPTPTAPVPAPLARALDRLDQAAQP
jgi:eukaryotic-like serine/threonine-protein kinase